MSKKGIRIVIIIGIILIGLITYKSMYTNLFGFVLKKSELESVLVYSNSQGYQVEDRSLVKEIVHEASNLKRATKINPATFPKYEVHKPMTDFIIQSKDHTQYGGTIWQEDASLVNANGYYWRITPELLQLLEKAIQDKQTKKLF